MSAAGHAADVWLQRFLQPGHAVAGHRAGQVVGRADTPAADAVCEIHLAVEAGRIDDARFALYGPPVAIACADWLCERISGRTIEAARGLSTQDMETALALAPEARYGAVLALDALNDAMTHLKP